MRSKHDTFSHLINADSEFYPAITFGSGTKERKERRRRRRKRAQKLEKGVLYFEVYGVDGIEYSVL